MRNEKKASARVDQPHLFVQVDKHIATPGLEERWKRVYLTVNAAAFIMNTIFSRYATLQSRLSEHEKRRIGTLSSPPKAGTTAITIEDQAGNDIVASAWDLVDWIDRLRRVIGVIAGSPKGADWRKNLTPALRKTEELRHLLQHFDRTLNAMVRKTYPPMGSLIVAFANAEGIYARVMISSPARYAADGNIAVAIPEYPGLLSHADGVYLSLAAKVVALNDVVKRIWDAKEFLEAALEKEYKFKWPESGVNVVKVSLAALLGSSLDDRAQPQAEEKVPDPSAGG